MVTIAKVSLPCNVIECELTIQRAAHEGHWHDAVVSVSEDGSQLIVQYPSDPADNNGK
jgi:hypothetical protein